jgi:hypothetical protein
VPLATCPVSELATFVVMLSHCNPLAPSPPPTHEMPPKKRLVRKPSAEDSMQEAGGHALTTTEAIILNIQIPQTTQQHISMKSHAAHIEARRPEGPIEQPPTQTELFTIYIAVPNP